MSEKLDRKDCELIARLRAISNKHRPASNAAAMQRALEIANTPPPRTEDDDGEKDDTGK